jgi:hypothetical protein
VLSFLIRSAPWSAALVAFITGAATGSAFIPAVFYGASDDLKAVLVVLCGLAWVPVGAALGARLRI